MGAQQLPVVIDHDTIQKSMEGKHKLSLEDLKKIPVQLNDPIMVFESESHPQTSFVIMTEITDQDGDTVIVAIHLDKQVGRHVVNDIASIYGKDEDRWFQNQILKGNLKYTDKERSRKWLMTRGLYLPKVRGVIYSSGNKILSKDDLVKPQYATHSAASDDKDLSGSCFAKDGSLERHSKRDELFLTANFSRRLYITKGLRRYPHPPLSHQGKWALNRHGVLLQAPTVLTVLTLSTSVGPSRNVVSGGVTIEFSRIAPKLFTGFEAKEGYNLATPEKALLDTIYLRKRVPFPDELDFDAVDRKKLVRLAEPFPAVVRKRLEEVLR